MARKRRKVAKRKRKLDKSPQEVLVKALNHPVRVKALTILTERTASPKEIAAEIDAPLSNVSYHVRVLDELGLVEIREEESVRGSVAHFYSAVERPLIHNPDWEKLSPRVRSAFSSYVIETLMSDAAASLQVGLFDRRDDRHLTRTPLVLKALDGILKEQSAAASRLESSGKEGIHVIAGLLCFEALPAAGSET
jgi:DNA-binding transcriptional ArsR family regulator